MVEGNSYKVTKKKSNFFSDLPGAQVIDSKSKVLSKHRIEYERLVRYFTYENIEAGANCLFVINGLKHTICSNLLKEDSDPNTPYVLLITLLKNCDANSEIFKTIVNKLPRVLRPDFEEQIQYVVSSLPNDYFVKKPDDLSSSNHLKIDCDVLPKDSIFLLSLSEEIPTTSAKPLDFKSLASYHDVTTQQKLPNRLLLFDKFTQNSHKMPGFTNYKEFSTQVQMSLNSSKSDNELVNEFLDTLGFEVFDLINEIIQCRNGNIDYSTPLDDDDIRAYLAAKGHSKVTPAMASQVIVQSEEEKKLVKKIKKLEKKDKGRFQEEQEFLSEDLNTERLKPLFRRTVETINPDDYPHVHDKKCTKTATIHKGASIKLPENAIQKKNNQYSEITIPGEDLKSQKDDFPLVKVSELDFTGKLVFKDLKCFNRIQSEVFPIAYTSNENLLICAPTGAGKTNIALLAIVHQIKAHMVDNVVKSNNFKIVYVCPMKALATEMVANFSKKLSAIGVSVKELTGEMQLSRKQISETHMLVTTPEKLDVITRKGAVDTEVTNQLKLLIIDEIHLLNGSRGPVIESIVARMLRHVVSSQSMIRIVGLSATLPGYLDVADFLKVNPRSGLFFFDNRFRSVPLTQTYVGMAPSQENSIDVMNKVSYQKMKTFVRAGHQVMVFVTARNQTLSVANSFVAQAQEYKELDLFAPARSARNLKSSFKSPYLHDLVAKGFGTHNAGMCRSDRLEIESLFRDGLLKCIVCTATLAWGVNLPAHAVIIRGTSLYDPQQSKFVDLDVLDILQIFGRAGRPQYDTSGHAILITSASKMPTYMNLLMSQTPIESKFLDRLPDNLNGEVVLGTISNIREALEWLRSSYLFYRLRKNPINYGLTYNELWDETKLYQFLQRNIETAAKTLEKAEMIRYDEKVGELRATSFGRIASFLYITYETVTHFLDKMERHMDDSEIFFLLCSASEFKQIQVRNDELDELDRLRREYVEIEIGLEVTDVETKVMILIQTSVSRGFIKSSSLASDCEYVMQNVVRVAMALHQLAVEKNYAALVTRSLIVAQMLEQRTWHFAHPLSQFKDMNFKGMNALASINIPVEEIRLMSARDLGNMTRNSRMGNKVLFCAKAFPTVNFEMIVKPITEGVIRIKLVIVADFKWDHSLHGAVQNYMALVEDPTHDSIYHLEKFIITERVVQNQEPVELTFTVPLIKPHSLEYFVKVVNTRYLHTETQEIINLDNLTLMTSAAIETKFLNVRPLPKTALRNPFFEQIYPFNYFNAVQSQVFHCCYNTDNNILLGAPTGSGKTIVSELCMLRLFANNDNRKVVYIAPMKALVRERVKDWTPKFKVIQKNVVEITGDVTPKSELVSSANIIITTPEKWDGMSRNWHQKDFVKQVGLVIIDEIHLLAEERGPVLEIIVSRMNYINQFNHGEIRLVGLSTAMANAGDLANWLGVKNGLFNFSSAVRPVPLEIHLSGFPGKNYCPRMATMNKPAYQAICQYAPASPVLIFVSSRKQTRITSHELIKTLMMGTDDKQWLHCSEDEIDLYRAEVHDQDLSYMLQFGVAIHHAGLQEKDRDIAEELFVKQKIQVLIATATLAWGVNFPAHLVIVKGTEYYDGATKRYVDMPVTDVLQMLGRAGRPQFDKSGVACVFVEESKKNFYRKFLFEPFPVESSLLKVLPDHVNAEISNGTISGREQLIDFICSTFFFRRLVVNPSYYQQEVTDVPTYLRQLSDSVVETLREARCVNVSENEDSTIVTYEATYLGQLAAKYYLSYKTLLYLDGELEKDCAIMDLLLYMSTVEEYVLFPVRHNEDKINKHLMDDLNLGLRLNYDSPHLKVFLLIYCYLTGVQLPNQEYVIDLKTVFDQIIRIIQAMISLAVHKRKADAVMKLIFVSQMIIQGLLVHRPSVAMLPHFDDEKIKALGREMVKNKLSGGQSITIPLLRDCYAHKNVISDIFKTVLGHQKATEALKALNNFPILELSVKLKDTVSNQVVAYEIDKKGMTLDCKLSPQSTLGVFLDIKRFGNKSLNVYSRTFSKQKDESWFCLITDDQDEYLYDFHRLSITSSKCYQAQLTIPKERGVYKYLVRVMSDSYIGLDQEVELKVMVV